MRKFVKMCVAWGPGLAAGLAGVAAPGQNFAIGSASRDGELAWTNAENAAAVYRVEWAAEAMGPFLPASAEMQTVRGGAGTAFTTTVERASPSNFYRLRMHVNWPAGLVRIDAGDVVLGDNQGVSYPYQRELPVHTNHVGEFWMDETEVTKAQWDEVAAWASTNGYDIGPADGEGKAPDHPVQTVSWYEAAKWCNARSQKEGRRVCYHTAGTLDSPYVAGEVDVRNDWVDWAADGYRLPTEAEWEKAARGGRTGRLFPWGGDTIQHAQANYSANTNDCAYDTSPTQGWHPDYNDGVQPCTAPAGSFPANGYGLRDMAGNVFEWCWDRDGDYGAEYQSDPRGPETGDYRVLRGGSYDDSAIWARCSARNLDYDPASGDYIGFGFRCVRTGAP